VKARELGSENLLHVSLLSYQGYRFSLTATGLQLTSFSRTPNSKQPTYSSISLSPSRIRSHILLYFQVVQHIKISVQFVILIERL